MQQRRPSFFSLPALLVMGVLLALVLYILFPRQAAFDDLRYLENPDAVSIAYLETLLKSDRDNIPLRINLGRMQRQAGQLDKARKTLAPLLDETRVPSRAMETYLELLVDQYNAASGEELRGEVRNELERALQRLVESDYPLERKLSLAKRPLTLLAAEQQLAIRERLFEQASGRNRVALAQELAQLYEARGEPARAVAILESVLGQVPAAQQDRFAENLIRLELAAGRPGRALDLFRQRFPSGPTTSEQLREGIRLANLAGDDNLSRQWLGALASAEPGDLEVQRRWLRTQLGTGDIKGALATLRVMERQPNQLTTEDRVLAAQILEWNGKPTEALAYWRDVYRTSGSDQAFDRATALARELFLWEPLVSILDRARERRQLGADGYRQLADSLVRLGQLDQAEARLREGMTRYRGDQPLRERLLTLLINRRKLPEAISLIESAPSLSPREQVELARLYWRTRDPESAFERLRSLETDDPELQAEAATLRLELATLLGRTDFLQAEYRRLANLPVASLAPAQQEQLLNLAVMFNDYPEALRLARGRFATTGEPRYLAAMAEYQLALSDWDGLADTLERWQQRPGAGSNPRYWTLKALLHQERNEDDAAAAAFETAATLAPENTEALISWGWFLAGHPERQPGALPDLLARLSNNPSPEAYGLLAWGYQALGDEKRALAWLGRGRDAHGNNGEWLLAMAPLAEQNGAMAEGSAMRRQAVALGEYPRKRSATDILYPPPSPTGEVSGPLYRFNNRAVQAGFSARDLGNFSVHGAGVRGQFSHDRLRWLFSAESLETRSQGLLRATPNTGQDVRLQVQNNSANTLLTFSLAQLTGYGGTRTAGSAEITGQPGDRFSLSAGVAVAERAYDSAEAWWLSNRDALYAGLQYRPFPRLELTGRLEQLGYQSNTGGSLGKGLGFDATGTYTLFHQDPAWQVSLGYRRQTLDLASELDARTAGAFAGTASPGTLLAEDYERIGLTTRWQHGEPGALYRTTPEPRYFVGLGAGYVLSTSSPDFGIDIGVGWRVVGDDDLALSLGYTSDGLDGNSRTDLNLTYTLYFGR